MSAVGWFAGDGVDRPGAPRIVCFPHAGGRAATVLGWQAGLGDRASVLGVRMPGREGRLDEASPSDVDDYAARAAEAVAGLDDGPLVLFGHSLGAVVAFETARALRGSDTGAAPRALVVSGCAAPPLLPSDRVRAAAALSGREFAEAVAFFGGLPRDVVSDTDLCDVLLPPLAADFRLVAGYRYRAHEPLDVPLTVVGASDDPHVGDDALDRWSEVVAAPPTVHRTTGGHFYFDDRPERLTDVLRDVVAPLEPAVELI